MCRPELRDAVHAATAQLERLVAKEGAKRPVPEELWHQVGGAIARVSNPGVQQKKRQQRAVHDESRIAFNLGHIAQVVVDAVGVEGERGKPKERDLVCRVRFAPISLGGGRDRRPLALAGLLTGRSLRKIHQVLFFLHRRAILVGDLVAHGDEHQRARAALLVLDRLNRGDASGLLADAQPAGESEAAARPHPAREGARQETRSFLMAVRAERRAAGRRCEVDPVPAGRESVPVLQRCRVPVERCGQAPGPS